MPLGQHWASCRHVLQTVHERPVRTTATAGRQRPRTPGHRLLRAGPLRATAQGGQSNVPPAPERTGTTGTSRPPAVRIRTNRAETRGRRKRPEAARHTGLRQARSASRVLRRYPTSSRLISSRQLPSDGTTIRPKSAVVISSFVLDPKVLWSSVTSFDARTPLHPRLVSSRLIWSYLLGSLLSHLISFKAPASQQGSSGPPLARAAPLPLAGSYRSSPRDRSTLPAAAAGLLHCGGGSLRPRVRAEAQRQRTN